MRGPPGYDRLVSDVPWDPAFLEFRPPEHVYTLEELGDSTGVENAFSPVAINGAVSVAHDDGIEILQQICRELEAVARGSDRIPKFIRGGVYRSEFLWGLAHDPALIEWLGDLAQAPIEPHPVGHHAVHINYAPDASIAFPPSASIRIPASASRACAAATTPRSATTSVRVWTGSPSDHRAAPRAPGRRFTASEASAPAPR